MQLLLLNSFINFLVNILIFAHVHLVAYCVTGNTGISILSILIASLFLWLTMICLEAEMVAILPMTASLNARFFMLFIFLFLVSLQSWVRAHHLRGVGETSVIYLIVWLLALFQIITLILIIWYTYSNWITLIQTDPKCTDNETKIKLNAMFLCKRR